MSEEINVNVVEKLLLLLGYRWENDHESCYDHLKRGDVIIEFDGTLRIAGKGDCGSTKIGLLLCDGTKVYRKTSQ